MDRTLLRPWLRALVAAPLVVACSSTTPGGMPGSQTDAAPDRGPADAAAVTDVPPGDVPPGDVPPGDVPVALDVPAALDVLAATDASDDVPPTPDVVSAGDGGGATLAGRWRVVAWESTNPDGSTTHLTDHDSLVPDADGGTSTPVRVNGILQLSPDRMSVSFGVLGRDHFFADDRSTDPRQYSATGFTVPGLLDDGAATFTVPGSGSPQYAFTRNADGTVSLNATDRVTVTRTTFARAPASPRVNALNLQGLAQLRHPLASAPLAHPRFAVLWDHPGPSPMGSAGYTESNGYALTFTRALAPFFLTMAAAPPAEVRGRVAGVEVAVGYLFVYDDTNHNGRFDLPMGGAAGDVSRGFGPLAVVWRGPGTPSAPGSAVADTQPGYQIAHLHQDYGTGAMTLSAYDTTTAVSPDVPVSETALHGAGPHLLP